VAQRHQCQRKVEGAAELLLSFLASALEYRCLRVSRG
jgi:hypothetical protein